MGKRYYCDFCNRSFQDNMHNRKKHLNGIQHQRAKKAWFDNFKDPAAILLMERAKNPCRMFFQKGICDFGPNCRYSHVSHVSEEDLKRKVEGETHLREDRNLADRSIEEWLTRREKKQNASDIKGVPKTEGEESSEESEIPQQLLPIPDLPPSLLPPPPGGWKVTVNTEWG